MKTTIKVPEFRTVEKEISFPYYSKDKEDYYCLPDESTCVKIWMINETASMTTQKHLFDMSSAYEKALIAEPCTEAEFTMAYNTARALIESAIQKGVEV